MDEYEHDFLGDDEGRRRLAVKRLTRRIELEFRQMTVNAPDWSVHSGLPRVGLTLSHRDTAFAAHMARQILWEREDDLRLRDYVEVSQS